MMNVYIALLGGDMAGDLEWGDQVRQRADRVRMLIAVVVDDLAAARALEMPSTLHSAGLVPCCKPLGEDGR
jgi:hypothetical protein